MGANRLFNSRRPRPQLRRGARGRGLTTAAMLAAALLVLSDANASAQSLTEALAHAYRYNPRLDAARATLRATDEEVARANSGYRPNISGSADVGYQSTTTQPGGRTETHPRGYAITAVQPLFRGGRVLNGVNEAEATVRAGREILRSVEQAVLLDAATSYMDVIRDLAIVGIREKNLQVLSRELNATNERFRVGEVTGTDVAQAQARRAVSVSALDAARAALQASRANFERHVGRAASNLRAPALAERLLPRSLQDAIAISQRESPFIVAALYREQASRHTVDRIWGELLPSMQVETSYVKRYDSSALIQESSTTQVVGRLTVPIYAGGEVHARVRQAKHTHVSRLQEIEQNRQDVQASVISAWSQLQAARAQLQSDQAQVTAFTTALEGVRAEERVGQRTLLDVLNAEQERLNAEVSLVTTRRNIVVAAHVLLSAIGRLNIQELGGVDAVYDPAVHYHEVRRQWGGISITRNADRSGHKTSHKDGWTTETRPSK